MMRLLTVAVAALLALVCLHPSTMLRASAFAAELQASRRYDIVVMVVANGPGPVQVVVSYPRVVDHRVLRASIEELGRRAGVQPTQVTVRDAPLARRGAERGTDVQFAAAGLVSDSGWLPVSAIIRSLPEWEHMRLVFLVPEGYPFSGPGDAMADGFAVRVVNRITTYEYDVERTNKTHRWSGESQEQRRGAETPPYNPEAAGDPAAGSALGARASAGRQVLAAVLIGLPSGVLVGWLLYGWRRRFRPAPRAWAGGGEQPSVDLSVGPPTRPPTGGKPPA